MDSGGRTGDDACVCARARACVHVLVYAWRCCVRETNESLPLVRLYTGNRNTQRRDRGINRIIARYILLLGGYELPSIKRYEYYRSFLWLFLYAIDRYRSRSRSRSRSLPPRASLFRSSSQACFLLSLLAEALGSRDLARSSALVTRFVSSEQ